MPNVLSASFSMHVTHSSSGVRVSSEHEHAAISGLVALGVMQEVTWEITRAQVSRQAVVALAMMSGRYSEEEAEVAEADAAEAVAVAEAALASEAEAEPETAARAYEAAAVMGTVPFEPRGARTAAPKAVKI